MKFLGLPREEIGNSQFVKGGMPVKLNQYKLHFVGEVKKNLYHYA